MIRLPRPEGWTRRDLLCGVLAVTAAELHMPTPLDVATDACAPLFADVLPGRNWFPVIAPAHARAAIAYAGRALKHGHITQPEYDFVCEKARRVIVRGLPTQQIMEFSA